MMRTFHRAALLLAFAAVPTTVALAQPPEEILLTAKAALAQEASSLGLVMSDVDDVVVTDSYTTKHNGVTHVYLRQQVNGLDVANGTLTLNLDRSGNVLSRGSRFVKNLIARTPPAVPILGREQAILSAAEALGLEPSGELELVEEAGGLARDAVFASADLSLEPIPVKLVYYRTDDGRIALAWDMVLRLPDHKHWWHLRVDAASGQILDRVNWIANDTYEVFPLPLESPSDGPRTVEPNPADLTASPFGWHDTDGEAGEEHMVTRGNNVCAQQDRNGNNGFPQGCGAVSQPSGGASLDFSASLDLATQQPVDYQDAAVINLFYWNNVLHDVLYRYGFDEAAGNFQENNYGNGGSGSDSVNADAQDGSGTNNANFGTPADGSNPRMQMFEWTPSTTNQVFIPSGAAAGTYPAAGAEFGPSLDTTGVTSGIVLVNDGVGTATDGCTAVAPVTGQIAMIDRGECAFVDKVKNAQNAGAVGAIVVNNQGDGLVFMGGTDFTITIPSVFIGQTDGATIKAALPTTGTIREDPAPPPNRDSDLDNGVIAHEYCHGLSNRLTNGPSSVSCLGNSEQAGEGWSDICTLFFSVTATDKATDPHGIGTYLIFQPPTGQGIRPAPYSVDMSVNALTYADLKTAGQAGGVSIPHGVGTVFATAAWDLLWKLVEKHGFDPDLYVGTGGNNIWFQLIVDGLKMQPCEPTFLDARDAILAADLANNAGANQAEIWEAFARRGMGTSADDDGSSTSLAVTEAFDVPMAHCATDITIDSETLSGWNELDALGGVTIKGNTTFDATSETTIDAATTITIESVAIDGDLALGLSPRPCT